MTVQLLVGKVCLMNVKHKTKRTRKIGRPQFKVKETDRRQVKTMVGYGIPLQEIAGVLGCDARTLRRHFVNEIAIGRTHANSQVAQSLFKNAVGTPLEVKDANGRVLERHERAGNVIAQIFWLKARAGWVDKDVKELTGPNGMALNQESAKIKFYLPSNGREERPRLLEAEVRAIEESSGSSVAPVGEVGD